MSKELLLIAIATWQLTISSLAGEAPELPDKVGHSRAEVAALEEVIAALPTWSSASGPRSFHVEICVDKFDSVNGVSIWNSDRVLCYHHLKSDNVLVVTDSKPSSLFTTDAMYLYKNNEWSRYDPTWTCLLKPQMNSSFMGGDRSLLPNGPIVADIHQLIVEGIGSEVPQIRHDQVTNSHILSKSNKSWIEIRLRSPNDAEQLGCKLSEVLIVPKRVDQGMPLGRMSIRGLMTNERHGARLNLREEYMGIASQTGVALDEGDRAMKASPRTAWLVAYPEVLSNKSLALPLTNSCKNLAGPLEELETSKEASWNQLQSIVETIAADIRNVQLALLVDYATREILMYDDPVIRWRQNEMIAWETMPVLSALYLGLLLGHADENNSDVIYSSFDAVADFGTPVISMEYILSRKNLSQHMPGQELFIETIFRSRHMYHVEPDEIDATVAALVYSQPGSEMERVAVETLLRLDEYDRVPPERFQRWWDAEIIQADKVFRWDTLCMLTFHSGNRAMLLEQLPKAEVKLRHKIWKNLKLRAESTVRTKRWDFMTETECQTVLALPEPPVLGKDTEGGAAKPFPKD